MSDDPAKATWIARVLGVQIAKTAAAGEAAAVAPDIAFRKLMLIWRAAQQRLDTSLDALAKDLLGRAEVQADPRFAAVQEEAARLPRLVPDFGGALEDALDAGINEGKGPRAAAIAAEAVEAIDDYRKQLAAASTLAALGTFAAEDLGNPLPLGAELDAVLVQMRAQLARRG